MRYVTAFCIAVLMLLNGCYGRASPKTCHAKYVRDGKGEPGDYDRCMAIYERREQIIAERRAGVRPSKGELILGFVAVAATLQAGRTTTADYRPYASYAVCRDGWTSGCAAYARHSGCCSYHGGLSNENRYTNRPQDWP